MHGKIVFGLISISIFTTLTSDSTWSNRFLCVNTHRISKRTKVDAIGTKVDAIVTIVFQRTNDAEETYAAETYAPGIRICCRDTRMLQAYVPAAPGVASKNIHKCDGGTFVSLSCLLLHLGASESPSAKTETTGVRH